MKGECGEWSRRGGTGLGLERLAQAVKKEAQNGDREPFQNDIEQ
jgi:hypothetical protein